MSLAKLAARLRSLPVEMARNLADAEQKTQEQARKLAVSLSSGTETARTLRRAGHPYSRRAPNASFDPSVINQRSGLFRDSWVAPTQTIVGRSIHTAVINVSPEAAYMQGTDRMVPRLIGPEVKRRVTADRDKRIDQAINKTLKNF